MKPFFKTSINPAVKDEWQFKEYGSWEDHNQPKTGHVYNVLQQGDETTIICNDREQAEILLTSAFYQTSWDSDDEIVKKLMKKASSICAKLRPLLTPIP